MPHLNNKQNKNTNLIISRQDYHLTQPWHQRKNKQTKIQHKSHPIRSLHKPLDQPWKWSRSVVSDCDPWTLAHQAPLSVGFSRQEYWSGLPFPSPGIFLTQGSNPGLPHCRQMIYHLSHQGSPGKHTNEQNSKTLTEKYTKLHESYVQIKSDMINIEELEKNQCTLTTMLPLPFD